MLSTSISFNLIRGMGCPNTVQNIKVSLTYFKMQRNKEKQTTKIKNAPLV